MGKYDFVIDTVILIIAVVVLTLLKVTECKLGKTDRIIKVKRSLKNKIFYVFAIYLIIADGYKLYWSVSANSLNLAIFIKILSGVLVAIMIICTFNERLKVMDKGIVYTTRILKKEDLLHISSLDGAIEIKHKSNNASETLKLVLQKEDDKETVKYLKKHFNIK